MHLLHSERCLNEKGILQLPASCRSMYQRATPGSCPPLCPKQWEVEKLKNLTIKTLKSPKKLSGLQSRQSGSVARSPSRASPARVQAQRRDSLDDEEDEWNQTGAWDRSGVPKSNADLVDEWQTASWARPDERQTGGGGGRGKAKGKGERKANITEADRILEKIAKGEQLKPSSWEGGGKVEREHNSLARGKGTWSPSRRR